MLMNESYLKERIAYYKLWLTFLYPTAASLVVWAYHNIAKIKFANFILISLTVVLIIYSILRFNYKTRKFLRKLEKINGT